MYCSRCGAALSSKSPLCPKCHAMMSSEQLQQRKEINGANNAYMERLDVINKRNEGYREKKITNTNNAAYYVFLVICLIIITLIVLFVIVRG